MEINFDCKFLTSPSLLQAILRSFDQSLAPSGSPLLLEEAQAAMDVDFNCDFD